MIIIRPQETQSLPTKTALPAVQYANDGSALATAGKNIANVSDQALQYLPALYDHQNKLQATQDAKSLEYTLRDEASKFGLTWDQDVVQQGIPTDKALEQYEAWWKDKRQILDTDPVYSEGQNPYWQEAADLAFNRVHEDVMSKARVHARNSFVDIVHKRTDQQSDQAMSLALLADAQGDYEGYQLGIQNHLAYLDTLKASGAYNPDQITKMKEGFKETIEGKRAYQVVTRDPQRFLDGEANGEFGRVEPKLRKELVDAADRALDRKVTQQDHIDKKTKEGVEQQRTLFSNDAIAQALEGNPSAALAQINRPEMRTFLGPAYDNTAKTIKSIAADSGVNDPGTIKTIQNEIDRNPSDETRNTLDKALENGRIKVDKYTSMRDHLTTRLDKLKDEGEKDRQKLLNELVETHQKGLKAAGLMAFDDTANFAQFSFEKELRAAAAKDPKLNVRTYADQLFEHYRGYIGNVMETAAQKALELHPEITSVQETLDARRTGRIYDEESDLLIWYFRNGQKTSTTTTASTSDAIKRKK